MNEARLVAHVLSEMMNQCNPQCETLYGLTDQSVTSHSADLWGRCNVKQNVISFDFAHRH
jgi:hypothetical protein